MSLFKIGPVVNEVPPCFAQASSGFGPILKRLRALYKGQWLTIEFKDSKTAEKACDFLVGELALEQAKLMNDSMADFNACAETISGDFKMNYGRDQDGELTTLYAQGIKRGTPPKADL